MAHLMRTGTWQAQRKDERVTKVAVEKVCIGKHITRKANMKIW